MIFCKLARRIGRRPTDANAGPCYSVGRFVVGGRQTNRQTRLAGWLLSLSLAKYSEFIPSLYCINCTLRALAYDR